MTKYKVVRFNGDRKRSLLSESYVKWATEMKEQYGLPFGIDQIIETWCEYSEDMAAGWLVSDKDAIEDAFGVELEEIEE